MGINLHARAISDSQKIHNGTLCVGGFNVPMKFTDITTPTPQTLTIQALYNDTSLVFNPETGLPMIGSKIGFSFHQSDLTIWNGTDSLQRWKIEFTNGAGQVIIAEINSPMPDRSFGDVAGTATIISGHGV